MKKYIIRGGKKLAGKVSVSGSKNVVLKALVAACLTDEEVEIRNIPLISDFYAMVDLVRFIGGRIKLEDHRIKVKVDSIKTSKIPLETGAKIRTSSMFFAPLLARAKEALIPNPGGCRIGARPIDWHIKGLKKMGAKIVYRSSDGYFHARANELKGVEYTFEKNTHTGTETMILASVLAKGKTILKNCAQEPEVDDLIRLLKGMGANVNRKENRTIVVEGVRSLKGASYSIMSDRNEVITFAIASALSGGHILIRNIDMSIIRAFLEKFEEAGGEWEQENNYTRFFLKNKRIYPTHITTSFHPGFMTDWQGPWAVLMTQANGRSIIHETVYESRFGYTDELKKMGAEIILFNPKVDDPEKVYNFNHRDANNKHKRAIKIYGKTPLHNAVITIGDLRAGATLVLAALLAKGESVVYGVEHIDRGYEDFDKRLKSLGADIRVIEE